MGLLAAWPNAAVGSNVSQDPNEIHQMIEKTKAEIQTKRKKEKSVLNNLTQQQQELTRLRARYDRAHHQLSNSQAHYAKTQQELGKIQNQLGSLTDRLQQRQLLLNKRLLATYKNGPQSYLEILFTARDFADLVGKFDLISYFVKSDLQLVDDLKQAKEQVNQKQAEMTVQTLQARVEYEKIAILHTEVSEQHQQIASTVKKTEVELENIQNDRAKTEQALDELEETSRALEAEIRTQQKGHPEEMLGTGHMIWPVNGPITSGFGWRFHPILRKHIFHSGIDIAVPWGTPVRAADSGVILVSGWQGGYGNFVAINHGRGISTCYGHNSTLLVREGERVVKGQKISLAGSTGLSTGPHVHFEVRKDGEPVDPISYLP